MANPIVDQLQRIMCVDTFTAMDGDSWPDKSSILISDSLILQGWDIFAHYCGCHPITVGAIGSREQIFYLKHSMSSLPTREDSRVDSSFC